MLGAKHRQAIARGICRVCGTCLTLFSSEQKLQEWPKSTLIPTERPLELGSNKVRSTNTDIVRVDRDVQNKR